MEAGLGDRGVFVSLHCDSHLPQHTCVPARCHLADKCVWSLEQLTFVLEAGEGLTAETQGLCEEGCCLPPGVSEDSFPPWPLHVTDAALMSS